MYNNPKFKRYIKRALGEFIPQSIWIRDESKGNAASD